MIEAINPATEEVVGQYEPHDAQAIDARLAAAERAFEQWRYTSQADRAALLGNVAGLLRQRKRDYADLMTAEMGKPIAQAVAEAEKCAWVCEHYAEHGPSYVAPQEIETEARRSLVRFDPLGPVLAIMPWNFPFWQVFRFAAPALVAGNVGLLKHAANVPGCALAIESVFRDAGAPQGAFASLLIDAQTADELIGRPTIRAVTLTGSERAGVAVARTAGAHLKKCVLELGGSDPFVVLADTDLDLAVDRKSVV